MTFVLLLISGVAVPDKTASGTTREVPLRWIVSPTPDVAGYLLLVGDAPRRYDTEIDLGFHAPRRGIVAHATVMLDADQDLHLALRAYDTYGRLSALSNEIVVPALDRDGDGIADVRDVCIEIPDPEQEDADGDGHGDRCDCDFDQDGFCTAADLADFLPDFVSGRPSSGLATDMDGDGLVTLSDFDRFLAGFTAGVPGPSAPLP